MVILGHICYTLQPDLELLKQISDGVFVLNKDGQYLYVNPAAAKYVDRSPNELVGQIIWEEFPEDKSGQLHTVVNTVLQTQTNQRYRQYYSKVDQWYSYNVFPIREGVLVWYKEDTERSKREEMAFKANRIILDAIDSFKDLAILSVDKELRYIFFNQSHLDFSEKAFDRTPQLGMKFFDGKILDHPQIEFLKNEISKAFEGEMRQFISPFQFPWGIEYVDVHLRPNAPVNGVIEAVSMFAWNETERVERDRELERTKQIINQTSTVAFTWSKTIHSTFEFVSSNVQSLLGYDKDELMNGKIKLSEIVFQEDLHTLYSVLSSDERQGTRRSEPFRVIRKDGVVKWVEMLSFNTYDEKGKIQEINSLLFDVDQIMVLQGQVRESEQRLEAALRGADLGVWDYNILESVNFVNKRWWEILGYEEGEFQDSYSFFMEMTHPDDVNKPFDKIREIEKGAVNEINLIIRMMHKDGQYRYILDRGRVVEFTKDGRVKRAIGTHMDITSEQKMLEHLRQQNEKWRGVAWSQSHEVRAPLARILGLLEWLDNDNENGFFKFKEAMKSSAEELDHIIQRMVTRIDELEVDETEFERDNRPSA